MAPFNRLYTTFYWSVIVNIALSCTVFDISYPLHSTPPLGALRRNIAIPFGKAKLEWWGYPTVEKLSEYV